MLLHNIKRYCDQRGITLSQLEKDAGIAKCTIYRWGESLPSVDKVQKVAKVLGVSVDDLMADDEQ